MMKIKRLYRILLILSIVLISGCNNTQDVDDTPSYVLDAVNGEESIQTNDEIGVNINEQEDIKKDNGDPFATKWVKAICNMQATMDGIIGINENVSKEERDQKFLNLVEDVQNGLKDEMTIYYRLCNIVAEERMAHLYLVKGFEDPLHTIIPIGMYWMDEKLYLSNIENNKKDYLGYEVVAINDFTIDELIQMLSNVDSCETDAGSRCLLEYSFRSVSQLRYCGIMGESDHSIELTLRGKDDEVITITVDAVDGSEEIQSATIFDMMPVENLPMVYQTNLLHNKANYCFTPDSEHKTMYFLYNSCAEMESETMDSFFHDMVYTMMEDDDNYERLVIDVRWNQGGSRYLLQKNLYMYRNYLNSKKICLITGIWTASAGVQVADDCMTYFDNFKIYGCPTAGAINNYTEVEMYVLDDVELSLIYPTMRDEIPCLIEKYGNVKESVIPDVFVDQTYEDFCKGIDTIYEKILSDTDW